MTYKDLINSIRGKDIDKIILFGLEVCDKLIAWFSQLRSYDKKKYIIDNYTMNDLLRFLRKFEETDNSKLYVKVDNMMGRTDIIYNRESIFFSLEKLKSKLKSKLKESRFELIKLKRMQNLYDYLNSQTSFNVNKGMLDGKEHKGNSEVQSQNNNSSIPEKIRLMFDIEYQKDYINIKFDNILNNFKIEE